MGLVPCWRLLGPRSGEKAHCFNDSLVTAAQLPPSLQLVPWAALVPPSFSPEPELAQAAFLPTDFKTQSRKSALWIRPVEITSCGSGRALCWRQRNLAISGVLASALRDTQPAALLPVGAVEHGRQHRRGWMF